MSSNWEDGANLPRMRYVRVMYIAFYHDAVIPPRKYGGTERVIYWLCQALNKLGHKTTLLAKKGSFISGTHLIEIATGENWNDKIPNSIDLIHLWSTPNLPPKIPFLITIEGNGRPGEEFLPNTVFISKKHAENHGSNNFVYNGLNINDYESSEIREDYLVFLAKASWKVKNLKGAIDIATRAKVPLHVLGSRSYPLELQRVLSQLTSKLSGVFYHGMVDDDYKRNILKKASGLLFPVLWHEPFGIALTEALASGCPVFGTPYGSLPEIITPEVGVLSAQGSTLVRALKNRHQFKPQICRNRVTQGFTHIDMAKSYLKFYEKIINNRNLGSEAPPKTLAKRSPEVLLDWSSP